MSERISIFRSPMVQAQYNAAYDAILKQWPVAYEELYIPTRLDKTHVIANGPTDALPVVLLPPGGGHAPIWVRNVGALSQSYRIYAVDPIGELNKSIPIRPIRSHREYIDWMIDLFDGLQIETTHLIGNSNGGFFALETALCMSERVRKVVLISPAATFIQMWAWWWHVFIPAYIIAPIIRSEAMIQKASAWVWQGFPLDECYADLRAISRVAGAHYQPSINLALPRVFSDGELRNIRNSVLLLIGDHEVIYQPMRAIQRASRLVTRLKAELVPNANHFAQYTAPDFINVKILEFLAD